jgi:hypothetical protein
MKRGFLLRAEQRKVAARRTDAQKQPESLAPSTAVPSPGPQYSRGEDTTAGRVEAISQWTLAVFDADRGNLAKGTNLTDEERTHFTNCYCLW